MMLCFNEAGELLYELNAADRYPLRQLQAHRWICMRPRAVVHIDLDQDNCQEIARKLDLWERLDTQRNLADVARAMPVPADAPAATPYSPAQNSTT
ncbi:MAG: hypothetical protein HYZ81_17270 [Nitrospinae bacterium]|nr:hypothetical protein [Nitrospinota bacterium]